MVELLAQKLHHTLMEIVLMVEHLIILTEIVLMVEHLQKQETITTSTRKKT